MFLVGVKFFRLFWIPALTHHLFLMGPQGLINSKSFSSLFLRYIEVCVCVWWVSKFTSNFIYVDVTNVSGKNWDLGFLCKVFCEVRTLCITVDKQYNTG